MFNRTFKQYRLPRYATHAGYKQQRGFVLTLEFILLMTILGIGLIVGIIALRDALYEYYLAQVDNSFTVTDSNTLILGKAVGFDQYEAPLIPYIDRTLVGVVNYRALVGIRADRFTSREPVYFTAPNCQGTPCVKATGSELGLESKLTDLQGSPVYAVGPSDFMDLTADFRPGKLFRQTADFCAYNPGSEAFGSRYVSQLDTAERPCEPYVLPPAGSGVLFEAESVPAPDDAAINAFDVFVPPFSVNLPQDPVTP